MSLFTVSNNKKIHQSSGRFVLVMWMQLLIAASTITKVESFAPIIVLERHNTQRLVSMNSHENEVSSTSLLVVNRRNAMLNTVAAVTTGVLLVNSHDVVFPRNAFAADTTKLPGVVVVAGATGQTGRRVLERLADNAMVTRVIGGVRNVETATKALGESSTVIRGAMIQTVDAVDITDASSKVNLKHLDVVMDSVDQLADTLQGANSLIIATGFIPGNPLKMNQAAHEVDNVGTCHLIDAAKKAGISKIVMVSSILTNGRNWGQEKSPGFVVTNAFGNVLDEKLVAENYLRASGIDYTIVRPGGLKAKPPSGSLIIAKEDTLNAGEVSRDLVAEVCIAALSDPKASNKVLEIIEDDGSPPKVFNGLNM